MAAAARVGIQELKVGEKGQIHVPARYRRAHRLSRGSRVVAVQLGTALVLLPADRGLEALSDRLQRTLAPKKITRAQLQRDLPRVRQRLFRQLYGE